MLDFKKIEPIKLSEGSHSSPTIGLCFMEMVAWFEGEEHSDAPQCACPVLGRYGIGLNDSMPDDIRNELLLPLVPKMAGTRCKEHELKRAEFIAIQTVKQILPIILEGLVDSKIIQSCIDANTLEAANSAAHAAGAAAHAAHAAGVTWTAAAYAANGGSCNKLICRTASKILEQAIILGRNDGFSNIIELPKRTDALLDMYEELA